VVCDVEAADPADIGTVGALARMQLTARRSGSEIRLRRASQDLRNLIALAGLSGVVPCAELLPVEVEREPEQREEPLGVEEEGDSGDPVT
jgi:hypothetical protein